MTRAASVRPNHFRKTLPNEQPIQTGDPGCVREGRKGYPGTLSCVGFPGGKAGNGPLRLPCALLCWQFHGSGSLQNCPLMS